MADPFANFDPFAKSQDDTAASAAPAASPANAQDPFANFDPFAGQPGNEQTSKTGAFVRSFVGGIAPAAGAIRGGTLGMEAGAAIGEMLFPAGGGIPGGAIGGVVGLLGGAYGGGWAAGTAQNYALNRIPKFRDMLGQSEEQKRLDEQEHPVVSFMGGMAPYAITMSPMAAMKALPENATNWQRLLANPYTSRFMSAGVVGGMQLGQEVASEDKINWNRVAIATAFGLAFNKSNSIGEAISEFGAKPIRRMFGLPSPVFARTERPPTIAETNESVAGPGLTEPVFMGEESRPDAAALAATKDVGIEQTILNPRQQDLENRARQTEPDLFAEYDALRGRQQTFRNWIESQNEPKPFQFLDLEEQRADLEKQLAEHVASRNGYTGGPEARSLRAKIRGVQAEHDALAERAAAFQAGTAAETPDIAEARKHLMATDEALRDIQPKIRNAYQAAAEYTGAPSIVPPPPEVAAPPEAIATETPAGAPEPGTTAEAATPQAIAPAIAAQKDAIAKDWSKQLVAAGRPQEEADLAGRLLATQYAAYSSWFGGTRGSPLELYKREGPKVIAGRIVGPSTPPPTAPAMELPPNPTGEQLRAFLAAGGKVAAAPRGGIVPPPVEAEPPAIAVKARAPRIIPPEKQSLFQFLASRGGLKAEPDTLAILGKANYPVPGFGNLVRENGMSIDRALEAATEAGYLTDAARERGGVTEVRPEDLRALMDEEARGNKQYREGIAPPTKPIDVEEEEYQRQAAQGQPEAETEPLAHLSQQDVIDFFQGQRGAIRFTQGMRDVITLLRGEGGANASTIIHELGHHFLKMFMTAAKTDDAPQWMRDASGTITRDLRISSADVLDEVRKDGSPTARARKAHEQFARTYEQYLFEGRAPSPELTTVFQRFRAWMQDIYDAVRGLGITISPEMRTVLDRMHVAETEPTVVGPTHPGGPTLTEIHEADAKTIEPAEAEPAADRVAAERDRDAQEQPTEIKLGIEAKAAAAGIEVPKPEGAEPAGQGGEVAGRPGEVVGGGGIAEPVAAGVGVRHEPGTVEPGGGNAGAEGATVPGGTAGGRGGEQPSADREHPLAPRPAADSLPPRETDLNDLAGNIRTRNLTDVEKAREAMMTLARQHQDFMEVRGGRITDEMAWQFASELGRNPAEMDLPALKVHLEKLFGVEDASPGMLAGRQMIKQMSEDVAKLSSVADEAKTPESLYNLAQAISRLEMGMNMLAPATASAGRTLRALRDISGTEGKDAKAIQKILKENTGRTLFQMAGIARLISKYDRSSQINQFISDSRIHPWRMIVEIWINGLISGLQTHTTYGVGNLITGLEKVGPDTAAAAGIGALRKAMGREGDTVRIGEVAAGLQGIWRSLAPAAMSAAESAETRTTTLLTPGEKTRFIQPLSQGDQAATAAVLNRAATWNDVMGKVFGIANGMKNGVVAGAALQAAGGVEGFRPVALSPSRGATPDVMLASGVTIPTGEIVRAPSRMIAAMHSFFRPVTFEAHIGQLAYREAVNHPIEGVPFDTQIANFIQKPPDWAMEEATAIANQLTLMDQGGEITRKLSAFVNHEFLGKVDPETGKTIPGTGLPILKFIDPFIHISTNIINQAIVQHTPVGILSPSIRADLMGKNGTIRADLAAGKMLAGTMLSLLFGFLAAEGYVTGSGPSNPDDAALWRQVYQPHSVRIGDTWYAMNRLGPMGMLLSTAADLYDVAPHVAEGEMAKAAAALGHAVAQNILDESFMRGPSDLIKAIDQPDRYGPAYVRNFVASFIPFSTQMRYMAQTADPYSRQARTIADTVRRGIPGLSMDLMPRRDPWGEPMPSRSALGGNLTAIWEQRVNADPTNQALVELGVHVGMPRRSILNVKLTDEQYDDYSRIAGRLAKMRMDAIVRSPSFRQMPPGTRQDYVNEQLKQSRAVAQGVLFQKWPSILVDAHAAKMAKRTGTTP